MDWKLIFSGTQSPVWLTSVILAIVLALVLCFVLMRYERQLVSPAVSRLLMLLRFLVLSMLLVTLLKPLLTRVFDDDATGQVFVILDLSESMEATDRHASAAERLSWAKAAALVGDTAFDGRLDEWIDALANGEQPKWVADDEATDAETVAALTEARKADVAELVQSISDVPRAEFARRLLQSEPHHVLDELRKLQPVTVSVFAGEQQPATAESLSALVKEPPDSLMRNHSRPAVPLEEVMRLSGGDSSGVVLFSDGRATDTGRLEEIAGQFGLVGIPIYVVPIGSGTRPRDLAIAAIDAPEQVFRDDSAALSLRLATPQALGESITVSLEKEGTIIDQQTLIVAGDLTTVEFSLPSEQVGRADFKVSVAEIPGELSPDNNSRSFSLNVIDDTTRILLVDGDSRWEFRYLANALDRDKRVELGQVLFRQPYVGVLNDTFLPDELPSGDNLADRLRNTDALIVGDVDPADLPRGFWEAVEKSVSTDGLTLVVIPGARYLPTAHRSEELKSLLPVRNTFTMRGRPTLRDAPGMGGIRLRLSGEAEALAMFRFDPDPEISRGIWQNLPAHPQVYGGTLAPAATAWAYPSGQENDAPAGDSAVIAHQYYGFGQVIWMGVDSTWRWRRRAGDRWHHRFWGQLVRWAARNKASAGNNDVRLSLSQFMTREEQPVSVVARWLTRNGAAPGDRIEVELEQIASDNRLAPGGQAASQPSSELSRRVELKVAPDAASRFEGQLPPVKAGVWNVRLLRNGNPVGGDDPVEAQLIVEANPSQELADMSCNRELLARVAQLSGGRLVEPQDVSRLPEFFKPEAYESQVSEERTLWDHWSLVIVMLSLMMVEWVVRKTNGLP